MECQFSEFQYGTGIYNEIWTGKKFNLIPPIPFYMPNLKEEADLGYDLALNLIKPIFIQFKVPEYLTTATASQYIDFKQPYHRFSLRTKKSKNNDSQHNILVKLAQEKYNSVYYVSPMFHTFEDFNKYHFNTELCNKSVFISLKSMIKYPDYSIHHVCYTRKPNKVKIYSEPKNLDTDTSFDSTIQKMNKLIYSIESNEFIRVQEETLGVKLNEEYSVFQKLNQIQKHYLSLNILLLYIAK